MGKTGTLTVRVVSDTKKFESGMDKTASKAGKVGDKFESAGRKMSVFATVPVAAAMGFAASAASDLNETLSKSNTVFGKSAKTIENWADGAVDDFGQSKREALDAASTFGNLFVQLGIGADQAAEMSMEMTELASDFASFHNADITQVLEAQTAAFRGEYDALQRFVPTINAATVEQRALEMTGKAATKELTAQEKALAVNKIMFENAGDAIGDFDRTQDSAANQTRKAKAAMEDAAAELGTALLPIVAKAAGGVADLAGAFSDLPDGVQTAIIALAGLLAAAGPVMTVGGKIANNWAKVSSAFDKGSIAAFNAAGNWKKLAVQGGALAAATIAVTKAVEAYGNEMDEAASDGESAGKKIIGSFDAQKASADEFAAEMNRLTAAHNGLIEDANNAKNPFLKERFLEAAEAVAVTRREMDTQWESAFKLRDELGITGDEAIRMAVNEETMGAAVDETTGEIDTQAAAADELDQAVQRLTDSTEELIGVHMSAEEATLAVTGEFATLTETLKENGSTLDINTEKGRANREQIVRTADSILNHVTALAEQGATTDEVTFAMGAHIAQLKATMRQAGLSEDEINSYINTLGLTPDNIATVVQLHGTAEAERALEHLSRLRIAQIQAQVTGSSTAGHQLRHSGGPVSKGTPYLVGRAGHEELFVPDQSGDIISGPKTDQILSGMSGGAVVGARGMGACMNVQINVHGSVYGDRRALMGEIAQAVRDGIPLPPR